MELVVLSEKKALLSKGETDLFPDVIGLAV
jgi:hypothetical protein